MRVYEKRKRSGTKRSAHTHVRDFNEHDDYEGEDARRTDGWTWPKTAELSRVNRSQPRHPEADRRL